MIPEGVQGILPELLPKQASSGWFEESIPCPETALPDIPSRTMEIKNTNRFWFMVMAKQSAAN
ncbi:MAG: hypothetical protein IPF81_03945 [Bacteroidetes bacterium]|nr:hypothetical protein [Bacteroidota bacterium]